MLLAHVPSTTHLLRSWVSLLGIPMASPLSLSGHPDDQEN